MRHLPVVLLCTLASACVVSRASENEPLPRAAIQSLLPGTSTAGEVVELLGAPVDVVQLGKRSAYLYRFTRAKRAALFLGVVYFSNGDQRADRVWVFFDENQVLTHVGVSLESDRTEWAMPWEELHD